MRARAAVLDLLEEWGGGAGASIEENDDAIEVGFAERIPRCQEWLLEAVKEGDTWGAVEAALWYGWLAASREARSEIRSAHLKGSVALTLEKANTALNLWPTHFRGKRAIENDQARGKAKTGTGVDRERLRTEVATWWSKNPDRNRSDACRVVLARTLDEERKPVYTIGLRTAMEYTKDLPRPAKKRRR